jgi:hypothetical protein
MCPTKEEFGRHLRTTQAGPSSQVPRSGAAKNVYHIPAKEPARTLSPSLEPNRGAKRSPVKNKGRISAQDASTTCSKDTTEQPCTCDLYLYCDQTL